MLLADMVINTIDAALQDREVTLDGIGVNIASDVFAKAVIDHAMFHEVAPDALIGRALVGHDEGGFMHLRL